MFLGQASYPFPDTVTVTPRVGTEAYAATAAANAPEIPPSELTPEQAAILYPAQPQPPLTPVQQAILGPQVPGWFWIAGGLLLFLAMQE